MTRTLAVICEYLRRGYAITVLSASTALAFLCLKLRDEATVQLCEMPDDPPLERGSGWRLYAYLALDLLKTWPLMRQRRSCSVGEARASRLGAPPAAQSQPNG